MNYRSVVALGVAIPVVDDAEKMAALEAFTEKIVPGRWADVRKPSPQEIRATTVMRLPLEEVSAKLRTGGPKDDDADYDLPVWAGLLPLQIVPGPAIPDPALRMEVSPPPYTINYSRKVSV